MGGGVTQFWQRPTVYKAIHSYNKTQYILNNRKKVVDFIERYINDLYLLISMIETSILKEIILSQKDHFKRDLGIKRTLKVKPLNRFATIISGVRRCGKSTLLRQILKNNKDINYIHFEDIRLSSFQNEDFPKLNKVFSELNPKTDIYFFDEIQNIEGWEIYVRSLVDSQKEVYITGSNASMLSKELGTRLTGRYIRSDLFPFNFTEFCSCKSLDLSFESFNEFLFKGGMPEFVIQNDPRILELLLDDIIFRDILNRANISDAKLVRNIVSYLISNSGKLISASKLKNIFEVGSVSTISLILNSLEDAYLIFLVPKYDFSVKKQIRNLRKVYCIDNGFISDISFQSSPNSGRLLENQVFVELKRRQKEVYYHQLKNECDFVIKEGLKITQAIQVCHTLNEDNRQREYNGLLEALEAYSLNEGLLLTFSEEDELLINGKTIIVKPVWKWLFES